MLVILSVLALRGVRRLLSVMWGCPLSPKYFVGVSLGSFYQFLIIYTLLPKSVL